MIRKDVLLRGVIFVLFLLLFCNWVQIYIGNCFYFLSSSKRVLLATCPFLSRIWTLVFVLVLLLWSPFQDLSLMWGPGPGGLVVSQMSWRPRDLVVQLGDKMFAASHPSSDNSGPTPPAPINMFLSLNSLTQVISFSRKEELLCKNVNLCQYC